ncbi:AraC family transcriptional regulator [Leptospira idonii]|uniref:AraC family transcriptional regulator n=1 Tax=Leptospira idonii TaxID=1193500 RepID=A0A4R9LUQ5_9LEPT|nr:helix-turn-helix domain-containing protein [Leptospira idonii]TGN17656.1 AraC family transcriptional regulator [Leptospira idonii]
MKYETFSPKADLDSLVKCYWTLEIPAESHYERQQILPDGCIEMAFILGEDIKRYTFENDFIFQPRAMVIGQITEPFYIEPTGYVDSFAVKFYPYGIANFVNVSVESLANKETPLEFLFGEEIAKELKSKIVQAANTQERIRIVEAFLLSKLREKSTVDQIVKTTIDAIMTANGSISINDILEEDLAKRRQLERKFQKQIGISPKKLGKIIRLQTALKMLLKGQSTSLTQIAYESDYFDQAHFIKDFKEFTGMNPKKFFGNETMILSSLIYSEE